MDIDKQGLTLTGAVTYKVVLTGLFGEPIMNWVWGAGDDYGQPQFKLIHIDHDKGRVWHDLHRDSEKFATMVYLPLKVLTDLQSNIFMPEAVADAWARLDEMEYRKY